MAILGSKPIDSKESGYVLNFSNRSFEEFFREVVKIDIYDARYGRGSGSKANRMTEFLPACFKQAETLWFGKQKRQF